VVCLVEKKDWSVNILPQAEEDLAVLTERDRSLKDRLVDAILGEFEGMKVQRIETFLVKGTGTPRLDRLDGSDFPGSIRIRIHKDYRATMFCLPGYRQAHVVHVFHKSHDPNYRHAVITHNKRLREFIDDFNRFLNKRK